MLEQARNQIDQIDQALVKLLIERTQVVDQVAQYKLANQIPVLDAIREQKVIEKVTGLVSEAELKEEIALIYQQIMAVSRQHQTALMQAHQNLTVDSSHIGLIKAQVEAAAEELIQVSQVQAGQVFVLGCSSSEVVGKQIGKGSNQAVGVAIIETLMRITEAHGLYLAVQGCEHINRALVVEAQLAYDKGLEVVSVVPQLHAGGACSLAAYQQFKEPVVVEHIQADLGMDIGHTAIGMHIKHVQVPVRTQTQQVGKAVVTCLRRRPKLIGGARAEYPNG